MHFTEEHMFTLRGKLQPHVQKACITKPLGSQNWLNHNKQWAISPLSPRLNFFIFAIKCITRGSKWWPLARGTRVPSTLSLHSPRMQPRDLRAARQGAASGLGLLCKNTWSYWQLTPNEKLPSIPICIKSTSQDPKLINSWTLTQQSFYFSKTDPDFRTQPKL